ncbi:MAG: GAF domain-containing protein [Oscillatoriales cyanobacterium]|uniref:histidine kinase n=1 Tax=Microcoleus anatoxicus PTRS2 TaxID=2705321 RepID=A0ABU8YJE0_9CYAN|nr:MAG: GAF domain-containing protein [Oscillatoriales cyanobacterium]TAD94050.1 MAG: GAF domain-containing protein [Oscillatoriales cyanobacterium]TAE03281.1 MAG: GAF domain-containing protein [Oscillatoriales cyanobacterium]TAF32172.1 MAG: GAF domain-containing protein [Oscillatoriales cyanobacterium]
MQNSANEACAVSAQPPKQTKKLRHLCQNIGISARTRWQQLHSLWEHRRHRRHLLTLLILGGTALSISTTACISYFVVRGLILDNLKEIALLKLEKGSDEIDNWLSIRKAEIETIAYSPTLRTLNWTLAEPILQGETYRLKEYFVLSLIQANGSVQNTLGTSTNSKDRQHFKIAMSGKVNVSDPLVGRSTKVSTIIIAAPIWALPPTPNKAIGVLAGSIKVDRVANVAKSLYYGSESYAFALNSQGVPIVHPNNNLIGNIDEPAPSFLNSPDHALAAIARKMTDRQTNIELVKIDKKWVYVAYTPLDEVNWSMALVIPRENIESQLQALNLLTFVAGGLLGPAMLAAIWVIYSSENNRAQAEREAMLNRISGRIRTSLELEKIVQSTVEEIVILLHLEQAGFGWYEPEQQMLQIMWECCKSEHPKPLKQFAPYCVNNLSLPLEKSEPIMFPTDIFSVQNNSDLQLKRNSYLAVPVLTQSQSHGYLICSHASHWFWSKEEVQLLKAVADQLAIAITQAHLYSQTQDQVKLLNSTLTELKKTQTHLVQSEKMSSLGQMVAGIAHEINNPVNFIFANLPHTTKYTTDLLELVSLYKQAFPEIPPEIEDFATEIELDFIEEDLPQMLTSMKIGTERIRNIVLSLRNFSRLDESDKKLADIHEGIDNTLLLLSNRIKNGIYVVKHYGDLPLLECYPSQLNQVFMNLLSNAIDALFESNRRDKIITISTALLRENGAKFIQVAIADNGPGIPEKIKDQIFNPFFTTKPVGKGTGLGLAISYKIVVEGHGGSINISTPPGRGTEFSVKIPFHKGKEEARSKKETPPLGGTRRGEGRRNKQEVSSL